MAEIEAPGGEGRFLVYVAAPEGQPRAAVIVVQEIFGVNEGIRKKCDDWAAQGYLAVAPDLFWRMQPGLELNPDVKEEFDTALKYMERYDPADGVKDIAAVIDAIRAGIDGQPPVEKVGVVGFCLGGKIAYMVACRTSIDASVGYYAVGLDEMADEAANLEKPLMLHAGTEDGFVPPEKLAKMHAAFDDNPLITLHEYEGMDHGFADTFGKRRDEAAATLADRRTAEFFARHLGRSD